nr:a2 mating pheromone [Ustilago maydis]
NRGQPGYYC